MMKIDTNKAELMFFGLQSDVIRKPQGQIEVNASSTITRGDGKQVLQVMERPPQAGGVHAVTS